MYTKILLAVAITMFTVGTAAANHEPSSAGEWKSTNGSQVYIIDSGRPEKVVFYVHGDGYKKKSGLESKCHSLDPGHELNAALVCVWRPDNNNRQRRHQPPEIDAFAKAVRAVSGWYLIHPLILLSNDTKDFLEYPLLHKHLQKPLHQWTDSLIRPVGNMVIQHQPLTKQRVRSIFHRVRL